jgi:ABC-type sugar transport system ATPase subunit
MIRMVDIGISTGQFHLSEISFEIQDGAYAVLMGQTGRGKTTLLEIICGLRRPKSGRVYVRGEDVTHWLPAHREIAYVPQDLALFPNLSVRQHIEFAMRLRRFGKSQMDQRVRELADLLGIASLLNRSIVGLSGGEAQRVALGRALSFRPSVLLLDEPLSALDSNTRQEMYELLRRIKEATGMTTLHVTHNVEDADALADQRLTLRDGQVHNE